MHGKVLALAVRLLLQYMRGRMQQDLCSVALLCSHIIPGPGCTVAAINVLGRVPLTVT